MKRAVVARAAAQMAFAAFLSVEEWIQPASEAGVEFLSMASLHQLGPAA